MHSDYSFSNVSVSSIWLFRNFHGRPLKDIDNPIQRIIYGQLDIKQGHFTREELDKILKKKIKNTKAACLSEIPPGIWKTRKYFSDYAIQSIKAFNREIDERLHPSRPQERWPRNHWELPRHNFNCYRCWSL